MQIVTATIVAYASKHGFGGGTIYVKMSVDKYKMLASSSGKVRFNGTDGMPRMVDCDSVIAISCGPVREE